MKKLFASAILMLAGCLPLSAQTVMARGGVNYGNGNTVFEYSGNGAPASSCTGLTHYTQYDDTTGNPFWTCSNGTMMHLPGNISATVSQTAITNALGFLPVSPTILAGYVPLTGATLTGSLKLYADPLTSTEAATKGYVDALYSQLGGTGTPSGGGGTTNQLLASKVTSTSAPSKICAAVAGINGSVACSGVTGTPLSITVAHGLNSPSSNTGTPNAVAEFGLNVNSSTNTQILAPSSLGSFDQATVFKREMWFQSGSNLAGVDNWELDTYNFDKSDQWEFMLGWQCNRHNTGFWQYDNFKHGWTNTAVPCSIIAGHVYHFILWMHRDAVTATGCTIPAYGSVASAPGPCEYWDTFQLDDVTAATSNTYTLNAKLNAEPAAMGGEQTWDGVGSQVQLDVVDTGTGGTSTLVSMFTDTDTISAYTVVAGGGGSTSSVTENIGNLGEYDFDANGIAGLTATGTPTLDNTDSFSSPNAADFNSGSEYYTAPITSSSTVYVRGKVQVNTASTSNLRLIEFDNGTTQLGNLYLNGSNGFPSISDSANSTTTACGTAALTTGVYHLVEAQWTAGASTGSYSVKIDGVQTCSVTGTNTGTSNVTNVRFGSPGSPVLPFDVDIDNFGISSTGFLGDVTINTTQAAYVTPGQLDAVRLGSLQVSNNLADLSNVNIALQNLGLFFSGPAATLVCLDGSGHLTTAGCPSGGGTGSGSTTLQTGGVNNTSQLAINFVPSSINTAGLAISPSNTSGANETFEITGSPNKLNGGSIPVSANVAGTDSSGRITSATSAQIVAALNSTPTTQLSTLLIPTNINITGSAASLSGASALPNGTTAVTQSTGDQTNATATDAFVWAAVLQGGSSGTSVSEVTGNLGEYDFDTTGTTGLTASGTPTLDTSNSYTPTSAAHFNATSEYYTAPLGSTVTSLWGRTYIKLVSIGSTGSDDLFDLYSSSGAQQLSIYLNTTNGHLSYFNQNTASGGTCVSTNFPTGVYHYVEFSWTASTTSGSLTVKMDGAATSCTLTGINTGSLGVASVRFGQAAANAGWDLYLDNVGFSSTGFLGAVTVSGGAPNGGGGASTPATSNILKGSGLINGVVAATPGTDYINPSATTPQTLLGLLQLPDVIAGSGTAIDARFYGVVGDGVTDSGTVINSMLSTVCANSALPRNILLPPGTVVTSIPIAPPASCYKLKLYGAGAGGRTGSPTQSLGSTRISYTGTTGAAITLGTEATPVKASITSASRTGNVITIVTSYNAALAALHNSNQIMVRGLVPSDLNTEDFYLATIATDGSTEVTLTYNSSGANETASSVSGAYVDYAHNDNAYYPSSNSGAGLENLSISCDSGTRTQLLNYQSYSDSSPDTGSNHATYATTADGLDAWRAPNLVLNHVNIHGCRYGFYGTNSDEDKFNDVRFTNDHIGKYLDTESSQFEDRYPYSAGNDQAYLIDGAWGTVVYNWTSDTDGSATTSPVTLQATQQARNTVGFKCVNCWFENNHGSTTTAYQSYFSIGEKGSGTVIGVDVETPLFSTPVVPSANAAQTTSFATIGNGDQIHVTDPINVNHTGSNIQPTPFFNFTGSYSPQDVYVKTGAVSLTTLYANTGTGSPNVIWDQLNGGTRVLGSKHTQVAAQGTANSTTTGYNSDFFDICGSFYAVGVTNPACWSEQVATGASFANVTITPPSAGTPSTQWTWAQSLASTVSTNQSSFPMFWQARVQHGGADVTSQMKLQVIPLTSGNDPAIEWRWNHSGSDTGLIDVAFPSVKSTLQGSETVAFSATPTYSVNTRASITTLTGNVTSFTLAAGSDGQEKTLTFCENGTGGFSVTAPSNVLNFSAINTAASKCNSQHFTYYTAQSAWVADGLGTGTTISGGSGVTLQTNGASNGSQTVVNFITSTTNNAGLTANAINSGSTQKIEITGSPTTLNGSAPPVSANVVGTTSGGALTPATSAQIAAALNATPTTQLSTLLIPALPYVASSLTVNGHALSANVVVSATDITTGTLPHAQLPALVAGDIPALPYVAPTVTVNGHALSSNVVVSATDITTGTLPHAQLPALLVADIPALPYQAPLGFTPPANTVTVNGYPLSSNVVVTASDISTGTLPHAQLPALLVADIPALPYVAPTVTVNGHALSANVVVAATDITTGTLPHAQLPALVSTDIPANAANTSGTASNLSGTPALPSGTTATTQATSDTSTDLATDAFVAALLANYAPLSSPTFTGPVTVNADSSTVPGVTIGSGSAVTNYFQVSGNRSMFGFNATDGNATVQGGQGHGVDFNVNGLSGFGSGTACRIISTGVFECGSSWQFQVSAAGVATAPTATAGDNSTTLATTAFVHTAVGALYSNNGLALPTTSIAANTCTAATGSPFTATGVTTNNVATFGYAGDPTTVAGYGTTGGLNVRVFPGSATVAVKVCNPNATAITPGAISINVRVTP